MFIYFFLNKIRYKNKTKTLVFLDLIKLENYRNFLYI